MQTLKNLIMTTDFHIPSFIMQVCLPLYINL